MIHSPPTIDIDPTIEHEVDLFPSSTFICLPMDVIPDLPALLRAAGHDDAASWVERQTSDCAVPEERRAYVEEAIETYLREGEIEIDNNAILSRGDAGAYVMAWVWIDEEQI